MESKKIESEFKASQLICSKCDDFSVSHCEDCSSFFCEDHSKAHSKSTKTQSHSQIPILSTPHIFLSTSKNKCLIHNEKFFGFCKSCFSVCCPSCLSAHHQHNISSFSDATLEKEKSELNFLIEQSQHFSDCIKNSLKSIDKMIEKTDKRASNLISSSTKFFFEIFQKILPEVQQSLFTEFQKNSAILRVQKQRAEFQLLLFHKHLQQSLQSLQTNDLRSLIINKKNLFNLFSHASETLFHPQRTNNLNLFCSNFSFDKPNEKLNLLDQSLITSSIVQSINQLFQMKLSIPSVQQIEQEILDNPHVIQEHEQRKIRIEEKQKQRVQYETKIKNESELEMNLQKELLRNIKTKLNFPLESVANTHISVEENQQKFVPKPTSGDDNLSNKELENQSQEKKQHANNRCSGR